MIRYVCTREFGGDEGKKVCIMIVCIVFTIPNVLLLIANENKPYFGGKTIRGSFKEFSRDQLYRRVAVAHSQLDFFSPHLFSANDRSIIISTISNYGYSALL